MSNPESATSGPREVHLPLLELPIFPVELNYHIASYLKHDLKALLAICSVSRSWRDPSHQFLFNTVSIRDARRFDQFFDLLMFDPRIGLWVRELAFGGSTQWTITFLRERRSAEWFYEAPSKLAGKLPMLQTLVFHGLDNMDAALARQAFHDVTIGLPTVESVTFASCDLDYQDLISVVFGLPNLKELSLSYCYGPIIDITQQRTAEDTLQLPRLEKLRIDLRDGGMDTLLSWFSTSPFVSTIRTISMSGSFVKQTTLLAVAELLKCLGPTLEELELEISSYETVEDNPLDSQPIDLKFNTGLRKLSFVETPIWIACQVLRTLPPSNPSERLREVCFDFLSRSNLLHMDRGWQVAYTETDRLLTPEFFRGVKVVMRIGYRDSGGFAAGRATMLRLLNSQRRVMH